MRTQVSVICLSGVAQGSVETTCQKKDTTGLESTSALRCWVSDIVAFIEENKTG